MKMIITLYKILVALQILVCLFLFNYPYWNLLLIYIFIIEYLYLDNSQKFKYINYYLSFKLLVLYLLSVFNEIYNSLFILGLFEYMIFFYLKENIDIYKHKINIYLTSIFPIILTIHTFSNELTFQNLIIIYVAIYLFLLYIKTIRTTDKFCIKNEFLINEFVLKLREIPISFLFFSLTSYYLIVSKFEMNFLNIVILFVIIYMSFKLEKRNYQLAKHRFQISFINYYLTPFLLSILLVLIYFILTIHVEDNNFNNYFSKVHSSITNIAILNIASLFVLIQLNYQKFGSSYLLKRVFSSPILLTITLIPSIILILSSHIIKHELSYLPTLLLSLSILSTLLLFTYAYIILDTNKIIRILFRSIKLDDFRNYKNNIINQKETNIDTVLKVITTMIKNNDTSISHSLFYNFACWLKLNISSINQNNFTYWDEKNNKFNNFFITIILNISNSKDLTLHQNFITSIQDIVMKNVTNENFIYHKIVFKTLFEYLLLMLENKNDEIAKNIYRVIYLKSSNILLNQPICAIEKDEFVNFRRELHDYKEIFIDKFDKVIDTGIENKNISFLKSISFYNDLFMLNYKDIQTRTKWDGKVFEIFTNTRYSREKLDKFLIEQNISMSSFIKDYEIFMPYTFHWEKNVPYVYDNKIINYVIDRLVSIYSYAIEKDKIKWDMDFEIIREQIIGAIKNNDVENFKIYISIFTYLIDKMCTQHKGKMHQSSGLKYIWDRLLFIRNNDIIPLTNNELILYIDEKTNILKNKFDELESLSELKINYQRISNMNLLESFNIKEATTVESSDKDDTV
jgi:hypothetical protein